MSGPSSIEWTEWTANPLRARNKITGAPGHWCEKISPGCLHCYASKWQNRLGNHGLEFVASNSPRVESFLDQSVLDRIHRRKTPTLIFLCDMTDLFGDWVPDEWIAEIWKTMSACPQHTFQILTKRPSRMYAWTEQWARSRGCPLPNVWCGVSVEDQHWASSRLDAFRAVAAAVKFVSYEPALGPVSWNGWQFVQQIISGGESGVGTRSRVSPPRWHIDTQHFCEAMGISYFFKQWGDWCPDENVDPALLRGRSNRWFDNHTWVNTDGVMMRCVGKRFAGRVLIDREWSEIPERAVPS